MKVPILIILFTFVPTLSVLAATTQSMDFPSAVVNLVVNQGLAVVLVLWWIFWGYPQFLKAQKETLKEMNEKHDKNWELVRDFDQEHRQVLAADMKEIKEILRNKSMR